MSSSTWIWQGLKAGESRAAQAAYDQYARRLLALVQQRMSASLQRRIDPEDILQSAYHSMFRGIQDGRFQSQRSGSFWRLLAQLTLNKLHKQIDVHQAARRDVGREAALDSLQPVAAGEPNPEDAAVAAELLAQCLSRLSEEKRRVLQMRLADHTLEEIASATGRSERTIRRWLTEIRNQWETDQHVD